MSIRRHHWFGVKSVLRVQHGFTLIEVLVAVIVLAIGLLGLANLYVVGQHYNHSAYLRSQAAIQAYDMADRMRANPEGVSAGDYNNISGIPSNPGCITSGCTPAQLAQYDAFEWNTANQTILPSGQGTVVFNNNPPASTFTITVTWDDDRDGSVDGSFSIELQP